jgi:hypothetical protein
MFRRACSWLLPVFFPLALLFAVPAAGAGTAQVPAIERSADADAPSVGNGPLHREQVAIGWIQWTDDDDDRGVRASATVTSVPITASGRPACASDVIRCTHSTSAFFPRGPPSA